MYAHVAVEPLRSMFEEHADKMFPTGLPTRALPAPKPEAARREGPAEVAERVATP
jgi:hypothetical protein